MIVVHHFVIMPVLMAAHRLRVLVAQGRLQLLYARRRGLARRGRLVSLGAVARSGSHAEFRNHLTTFSAQKRPRRTGILSDAWRNP